MDVLTPGADPERFLAGLAEAPSRVLLLDYDGTLAPFRVERDRALPYPGVREAVRRILEGGTSRVVVISGRALDDLRPLLGIEPPPELWGTHGWERLRPGSEVERGDPGPAASAALLRARDAVEAEARQGRVEVKPASVAVHIRGMNGAEAQSLLADVRRRWELPAQEGELDVHAFDGGLELRVPGRDKGRAVREALADEPAGATVAYLGDDVTDEDAFRALEGRGLPILVRREPRPTAAHVRLDPPDELLAFLAAWERASRGGPGSPSSSLWDGT